MTITAEQRQIDLVDRLAAEARRRVPSDQAESAEHFVRRYFAHVAPDDVIYTSFDTLLGGALSLWELGAERKPGSAKVRLFNPTVEKSGWGLEHTVVEIVNDDMPFLVDSVSAEIHRRDRKIHLLLHPVIRTRRDEGGRRVEVTDTLGAPTDATVESYMHIEIDQETEPAELESIRAAIEHILDQVRLAVRDWRPMRKQLTDDVAELDGEKLPMPPEEVDEARAFLRWLDDGNFIFLGFRRYVFETRDGNDYLRALPESGLGILSEMRAESKQRGAEPLSREFSDYARRKDLIIITKANSRSLIHRPVTMDRIGIKRYDASGNLVAEDRFLGLFTSAAYIRSVKDIPMLRLKTTRTIARAGLDPHSHNGKALVDILETFPRDEFFQITDADFFTCRSGSASRSSRGKMCSSASSPATSSCRAIAIRRNSRSGRSRFSKKRSAGVRPRSTITSPRPHLRVDSSSSRRQGRSRTWTCVAWKRSLPMRRGPGRIVSSTRSCRRRAKRSASICTTAT
jgi:glutamate dehydrogenase